MLTHPQFDTIAIRLGPLAVHWYGLMYLLGFMLFLRLGKRRIRVWCGIRPVPHRLRQLPLFRRIHA